MRVSRKDAKHAKEDKKAKLEKQVDYRKKSEYVEIVKFYRNLPIFRRPDVSYFAAFASLRETSLRIYTQECPQSSFG
jgi:hypothetical protein